MAGQGDGSLVTASHWLVALITGSIATTLLTLAIASLGFAMLTGRLPLKRAGMTILGCFLFLGASSTAAALMQWSGSETPVDRADAEIFNPTVELKSERKVVLPDNYDPYAGAAVMREQPSN